MFCLARAIRHAQVQTGMAIAAQNQEVGWFLATQTFVVQMVDFQNGP